jgi:hypothetical protein
MSVSSIDMPVTEAQVEEPVTYPITKKLMIESQSNNGKCYIRLLSMLPAFKKVSLNVLENVIVHMTMTLGSKPDGTDVITELYIANELMIGATIESLNRNMISIGSASTGEFMRLLFNSRMRYTWEEIDGVHHIGGYIEDRGGSGDGIFNDFGYDSRFVLCMIVNPGVKVGAKTDYAGLFDEVEEIIHGNQNDSGYYDTNREDENEELRSKMHDRLREIEQLNSQVRGLQSKIARVADHQRSPELDELMVKRFNELFEKRMKMETNEQIESTELSPDDSSSHMSRYKNKYLDDGTIFDVNANGTTQLSTIRPISDLRSEKQVVVGFKKTQDMLTKESKIYSRVNCINGLANPFQSHRLNFLCHFDTAIRSIRLRKGPDTYYDKLKWISNHKSMSPSQELLYQVVINTFDFDDERVVANPYRLPFLEVGMLLSDECLATCFDLIRLEFKSLWFDKMKFIMIPDFHDDFKAYSETRLTSITDKVKKDDSSSPGGSSRVILNKDAKQKTVVQHRKRGTSLLGLIRE